MMFFFKQKTAYDRRMSDRGSDVCSSDLVRRKAALKGGTPPPAQGSQMPQLILIRHGQSRWNLENRFTGWWDVDVTEKGVAEAIAAGELMKAKGIAPDTCFTSVQSRDRKSTRLNSSH